jgi:hypothetical protein
MLKKVLENFPLLCIGTIPPPVFWTISHGFEWYFVPFAMLWGCIIAAGLALALPAPKQAR